MRWIRDSVLRLYGLSKSPKPVRLHVPKEFQPRSLALTRPSLLNTRSFGIGAVFLLTGFSFWTLKTSSDSTKDITQEKKKIKDGKGGRPKLRFLDFASVQIKDQYYMTPKDFLESMTKNRPSVRFASLKSYSSRDVEEINTKLPSVLEKNLLTKMDVEGLFSYEDYVFLFSLMTKNPSSFRSAFKLLDLNGNQEIDATEFKTFCQMTTKKRRSGNETKSSLFVLFFGKNGLGKLSWKDFESFLDNFQREVLLAEFNQYLPRNSNRISEKNFAKIILRHSDFSHEEYNEYMRRIDMRLHPRKTKGITFKEFYSFTKLLNRIDDLCIAVRMINFAGIPMNKKEFKRAADICLHDDSLTDHMIDVIFTIFDIEGDLLLSYNEFLSVAKKMQRRKCRPDYLKRSSYNKFKHCVREVLTQDFYGP